MLVFGSLRGKSPSSGGEGGAYTGRFFHESAWGGTAGDHKGLVKIPRIFLALPNPTALARVLDKSALYD